jgi:hypothetical protein
VDIPGHLGAGALAGQAFDVVGVGCGMGVHEILLGSER